jgi:hypothetical protein
VGVCARALDACASTCAHRRLRRRRQQPQPHCVRQSVVVRWRPNLVSRESVVLRCVERHDVIADHLLADPYPYTDDYDVGFEGLSFRDTQRRVARRNRVRTQCCARARVRVIMCAQEMPRLAYARVIELVLTLAPLRLPVCWCRRACARVCVVVTRVRAQPYAILAIFRYVSGVRDYPRDCTRCGTLCAYVIAHISLRAHTAARSRQAAHRAPPRAPARGPRRQRCASATRRCRRCHVSTHTHRSQHHHEHNNRCKHGHH